MSDPIYGIDLGTTNSCLAVMDRGKPNIIPIDGQSTVPSVVSLDEATGKFVVGTRARNRALLYPEATVASVKRRMGETKKLAIGKRNLLPEEISAEILRFIKQEGEKTVGKEVRRAVITVPAYFEDAQRRATIRAGELAGLEVVRIINEPTAAALVYERLEQHEISAAESSAAEDGGPLRLPASQEEDTRNLIVYDLGGGTFDVSVVKLSGEVYEVCASCGDTQLGGDDFDQALVDHLLAIAKSDQKVDLSKDPRAMARLRQASERAKIELSDKPYTEIMEEALGPRINLRLELERTAFEEMIEDRLERTLIEVERAFQEAGLSKKEASRVILVGGSTRIPKVLSLLEEWLERPVEHSLDPDLCVALGAAAQGAVIAGETFDRILIDVAAHSLGIKATITAREESSLLWRPGCHEFEDHDAFGVIIPRNTQIPVTRSEVYYTNHDNQERVNVEVFQGEDEHCINNTEIGSFFFKLLPAPVGSPLVVEFSYDLDGIIHVEVHQKDTDNRKEVTLSSRHRKETAAVVELGDGVDNFIIRKARRLAQDLPTGELRQQLESSAAAYAAALGGGDSDELDQIEDKLLEILEEVEEMADQE